MYKTFRKQGLSKWVAAMIKNTTIRIYMQNIHEFVSPTTESSRSSINEPISLLE